jgi:steroid delta-isomerase-like uncharacterized protein
VVTQTDENRLSVEQARLIVAPLYEALNRPNDKDVGALLAQACHEDYQSFSTNQDFMTRNQLVETFKWFGGVVPDLSWEIVDLQVIEDQVLVRGEAKGTPSGDFFGVPPSGKSFRTMALDLFTVRDGKLAKAYHIENWTAAIQQLAT